MMGIAYGAQVVSQQPGLVAAVSAVGGSDSFLPIATPDGQCILYTSAANNHVANAGGQAFVDYVPAKINVFLSNSQAGKNFLVSVNAAGTAGGNGDSWPAAISADGRYVLFESAAPDLVAGDANNATDVFLRDLINGTTTLVSVNTNGFSADSESREATMTPDGRYVGFVSAASDLVPGDTNGISDVFVRDMMTGKTTLASPGAKGVSAAVPFTVGSSSEMPVISADGRYVAFYSTATNLVTLTNLAVGELYLRDIMQGVTIAVSSNGPSVTSLAPVNYAMSTNGQFIAYQLTGGSAGGMVFRYNVATGVTDKIYTNGPVPVSLDYYGRNIDISADGSKVVFTVADGSGNISVRVWRSQDGVIGVMSGGSTGQADFPRFDQSGRYVAFLDNELHLTTNSDGGFHVFVRDTMSGKVQLVDASPTGTPISSVSTPFCFAGNGNWAFFECRDGAFNANPYQRDVFGRDLVGSVTEIISGRSPLLGSATAAGASGFTSASVSSNGQYVAFYSDAAGLGSNTTWGVRHIFVHDFLNGSNILASAGTNGAAGSSGSFDAAISADGRYVALSSFATNLAAQGTNTLENVFVHDLQTGSNVLVSVGSGGQATANGNSSSPQISANGRYVLFFSLATNLVPGGTNEFYWRDLQAKVTYGLAGSTVAAITPDGSNVLFATASAIYLWHSKNQSNTLVTLISAATDVAISADATRAAFANSSGSYLADLVARTSKQLGTTLHLSSQTRLAFSGDGNYLANLIRSSATLGEVYLYNYQNATNVLVSQSYVAGAAKGNCDSLAVNKDGRYVAYRSVATNLVPNDTNGVADIFLYDRLTGGTTLVSVSQVGNHSANGRSANPFFSGDGQTLFFQSWASDVGQNDFNQSSDLFALPLSVNSVIAVTNVLPPLEFSSLSASGTDGVLGTNQGPSLTWAAVPGMQYQVQFKNDLSDSQWQNLSAGATVVGGQGQVTDTAPNASGRFYRIVTQ